jgi:hypothetical protein
LVAIPKTSEGRFRGLVSSGQPALDQRGESPRSI